MGMFKTPLDLVLVEEAGTWTNARWVLDSDFVYSSDVLRDFVVVPKGFETDLASVPRLPVVWLLAGGRGDRASVIHDYLYRETKTSKAEADAVFYEALIDSGTSRWRAWLMYQAVVWFGVPAKEMS